MNLPSENFLREIDCKLWAKSTWTQLPIIEYIVNFTLVTNLDYYVLCMSLNCKTRKRIITYNNAYLNLEFIDSHPFGTWPLITLNHWTTTWKRRWK